MSIIRACVFDLDGTLSNSLPLIIHTSLKAWQDLGHPQTEEFIVRTIGVPLFETGQTVLGEGRGQDYVDAYHKYYYDMLEEYAIKPFPGIIDMLAELRQRGYKLALCTSKRTQATEDNLLQLGIADCFEAKVCAEHTEQHKPHPAPALYAARQLGVDAAACVFIGDSIHDMSAGAAAGMATIAVSWGAGCDEDWLAAKPTAVVNDAEQLLAAILNLT